ncbi:33K [Bat mastadenovirus]|uniref:33K n=1 Tax=Bat mastadenovirus TaxID=740971 RepID=A0A3G9EAM9_9ADEN|nr:33K [Bat mastadenovirus]BBE29317.1 33K [Bat mastadenovirus]
MEDKEILSMEEISSSEEEEDLENPQESPELYSEEAAEPVERAPRWDQKTKSLGKELTSQTTLFIIIILATAAQQKPKKATIRKIKRKPTLTGAEDSQNTRHLRNLIFPTLYAIFQQSRGAPTALKIKNRSLRSLLKSCLYHKSEEQLQRTQEDAEALLNKYCQGLEPNAE